MLADEVANEVEDVEGEVWESHCWRQRKEGTGKGEAEQGLK